MDTLELQKNHNKPITFRLLGMYVGKEEEAMYLSVEVHTKDYIRLERTFKGKHKVSVYIEWEGGTYTLSVPSTRLILESFRFRKDGFGLGSIKILSLA